MLLVLLILFSAMPDTMAAPVVKELFIDRYGASAASAQLFNGINLLGAIAAIPLLWWGRRRWSPLRLLVAGSLCDAALLWAMILPLGLGWTLALRSLEGVTDVIVFAAVFELVRRSARGHLATGLGIASTPLLLGLGIGAMVGGFVVRQSNQHALAGAVFGISGGLSILVALLAPLVRGVHSRDSEVSEVDSATPPRRIPLWPALAMTFSDRATGGLITGTLPIALSQVLGYSALVRGLLVGLPLLLMALGTGPSGWLCDRVGSLRVRLVAGIAYAGAFALLPYAGESTVPLGGAMIVIGIAASALFASSLALAVESGSGAMALGSFRGAGDLGFLCGTAMSVVLLSTIGGDRPSYADYGAILLIFAGFHAFTSAITVTALSILNVKNRAT